MTVTPRASAAVLALGAMLGAGIFSGFAPAAALAGPWTPLAAAVAALAALCCAFATAEQHRARPDAAGGYTHVRDHLGPWPARIAASAHLVGRAGVAAALAGAVAAHAFPQHRPLAAVAVVVVVTGLRATGLRWSGKLTAVLTAVVVGTLVLVVATCFALPPPETVPASAGPGLDGLMGAACLLFVAFTGFERVTAPHPGDRVFTARQLRVAVPVAIGSVLALCVAVAVALDRQLGQWRLALSPAPLRTALTAADGAWLLPLLGVAAVAAGCSALWFVLASAGRTLGGMARTGDLPPVRGRWPLEVLAGALALSGLLMTPSAALAVGACGTAFHYGFGNAAARVMLTDGGTWAMRGACLGLALSVLLAMSAPTGALVVTGVVMAVGTGLCGLSGWVTGRRSTPRPDGGTSERRDGDFLRSK
ncbi:APA family basic amino acid/polyamine antiporter [Saccharothrix coeruleofusca]|uniref:APC family permease n=1 Tax=Saccharothrix coeruleofusca TaxID=33919 RepID=UPI001AE59657|nr:APC family permease [Saccharothrix coeruleofusca]MBP2334362.1 APA family basic amino acid/polyamine antiporter [Saccharothrix coeruleofusca]